jgi:glycosyltransferase involved in cell wall biosynthesis
MKALHFGRFHNDNFGGLERHVALLLRGLSRVMHVDNLVANESFSSNEFITVDGYRVYKTPSLGVFAGPALCPTMPWIARRLHREEKYDIVHLHFPDPMSHLAALALPKDVKVVISWHSDIIRQQNILRFYRPFLDRLVARADAIVAATPAHFTSSTQLGAADPGRQYVVPYGVDYSPYDNPAAIASGRTLRAKYPGRQLIFTVGRQVYYKGFEYLVRAMRDVRPEALLLMGGAGPLHAELRALAESEGVADRVQFIGRIPDTDLPSYYHAADLYCMPSVDPSEAFGLVQVEAMICRKPVICCELGNGVNYVNQDGKTGLVVPPREPRALAFAINKLLEDDALRISLGDAGRLRADEFKLQRMWDGMFSLYGRLVS